MTKLLAIETIGLRGSVAAAEDGTVVAELPLSSDQRSAQSLVPAIDLLLRSLNWTPSQLDTVAVAAGPGSFTGLRVGVTTAKILAWSCGAGICGVNSFSAAAFQTAAVFSGSHAYSLLDPAAVQSVADAGYAFVSFALDAQRGDVSFKDFLIRADSPVPIPLGGRFSLLSVSEWLNRNPRETVNVTGRESINLGEVPHFFAGTVLSSRRAASLLSAEHQILPDVCGVPTAKGVVLAALPPLKLDDPFTLLPVYSRESAAEEKRKQLK